MVLWSFFAIAIFGISENSQKKVFFPSQEWKEVPQDHSVPAGLEIRLDLDSGKRFARILDPSDSTNNPMIAVASSRPSESNPPCSTFCNLSTKEKSDSEADEEFSRFRTLEEIKKELGEELLSSLRTEVVVFGEYFRDFKKTCFTPDSNCLSILSALEEMISSSDHAVNFFNARGFERMMNLLQIERPEEHCLAGLKLIGSAVQNNEYVQNHLSEKNFSSAMMNLSKKYMSESPPKFQCVRSVLQTMKMYIGSCESCAIHVIDSIEADGSVLLDFVHSGYDKAKPIVSKLLNSLISEIGYDDFDQKEQLQRLQAIIEKHSLSDLVLPSQK